MIRVVLTDIEGTTTPIAFVHEVLFPYARARLPDFIAEHRERADVASQLADTARLAPGRDPLETLLAWMDGDAKQTPLKTLQGMIWDEGYASGALRGALYPDVEPALWRLRNNGIRLYVYSSGSVQAQRLIFRYSVAGDLSELFDGYFDTLVGPKREPASYTAIADAVGVPAESILFLSDVEPELAAAEGAGMATCQLVREADGTLPAAGYRQASDFSVLPVEKSLPKSRQ